MTGSFVLRIAPGVCPYAGATYGGKVAGLLKLANLPGVRVPEGVALPHELFEQVLSHLQLEGDFARWCISGDDDLADRLARTVKTSPLPQFAAEEIGRAIRSVWHEKIPTFVVRSSAGTEDQTNYSSAGRCQTVLPVSDLATLGTAIPEVWASLLTAGHAGCRCRARPTMGVVIQRLIPALASGVAFGGAHGVIIELIAGLAGPLVNGDVRPSRWEFDALGSKLFRKTIVAQAKQRVLSDQICLHDEEIPLREQVRALLSDRAMRVLAKRVARIAEREGEVDLEFCIDEFGRLFFVQLRPQTQRLPEHDLNPLVTAVDEDSSARRLFVGGQTAAAGAVAGRLVIIEGPTVLEQDIDQTAERHIRSGDVLVIATANIGATRYFPRLGGIVAERGGTLSHPAILAREYRKPAIVGAGCAVRRTQAFFSHRLVGLAPGVWAADHVSLDANLTAIFDGQCRMSPQPLISVLQRRKPSRAVGSKRPTEWVHFVESVDTDRPAADSVDGQGWTGKPEYRLCPLQLELSLIAWKKAFRIMNLSKAEVRLRLSVIAPFKCPRQRADGAWLIGNIRPGETTPASSEEYLSVAFATADLCHMGDRLLEGSQISDPSFTIPPVVKRIHILRKAAFRRLARVLVEISQTADVLSMDWARIFRVYSSAVAFAHLRATFRRRVAQPLRERAIERLPLELRSYCSMLTTMWGEGLATATTHARELAFRELMFDVAECTALVRDNGISPQSACFWLHEHSPAIYSRLRCFAESYKFNRYDQDTLESEPAFEQVMDCLLQQVAQGTVEPVSELHFRTSAGYRHQIAKLRPLISSKDSAFDFDGFVECLVMAREIPAMTDYERHLQHRFQQQLRKVLLELQDRLRAALLLREDVSVFECGVKGLLSLVENGKNNGLPTTPGCGDRRPD